MLLVVIRSIHSIRAVATVATLALLAAQTSVDASDQQPIVAPALQEAGAFDVHDLSARRADRHRAGRADPYRRRLDDCEHRAASARRSTSSRAVCRCATPPTGGRSSSRSMPPCAGRRRRFAPRRGHDGEERRSASAVRPPRRPTPSTRPRVLILPKQLLRPVRGARRAAADGGARHRRSRSTACRRRIVHRPRRRIDVRADSNHGATDRRAPDARHARASRRAASRSTIWTDETGRMIRLSAPGAVARGRARRHRCGLVADRDASRGRTTNGSASRATASRSRARLSRPASAPPASCRPSCSSAPAAPPIATASRLASRFSANSPARSPTPASSWSATTSAASVRAAAVPNRPACWTTPKTCGRRSRCCERRKDVDPKRIAVIGHSEGGIVALTAAAKDKRIAAVAVLGDARHDRRGHRPRAAAADCSTGRPCRRKTSRSEIDAQKRIHEAVITGKGLELLRARRPPRSGQRRVSEPARRRSGEDPARRATADADRAGRPRHAGGAVQRRPSRSARASAQERAAGRGGEGSRRQPSARARHDRRNGRVSDAEGQARQSRPSRRRSSRG